MNLNFLRDDWNKAPQNYRYLILSGGILIFLAWLLDNWGTGHVYKFWGADPRSFFVSLGLTLVAVGIFFIALQQIWLSLKISYYKSMYPLSRLGKSFKILRFGRDYYLFDDNSEPKRYCHIASWNTALDLGFDHKAEKTSLKLEDVIVGYEDGGEIKTRD